MIAIHRFLLVIARPILLAPVDPYDSLAEIIRVTKEEVAIMAMRGDMLVGTMGVIRPAWWYNTKADFLTDRWNFCIESEKNEETGHAMMAEAKSIAQSAGLIFINQGKIRKMKDDTFLMIPRAFVSEPDIYTPQGSA